VGSRDIRRTTAGGHKAFPYKLIGTWSNVMKRKKVGFLKRAVLLGAGALLLFIVVVLVVYPYERAIDGILATVARENNLLIEPARTDFSLPNNVTFQNLRIVPNKRPYHLLETEFTKLTAQIGLKALLARRLRVKFSGEINTGDPEEGNYTVSGVVSLRQRGEEGAGGAAETRTVELEGFRVSGSDVNFTVDGRVTSVGEILNPTLDLSFSVEELGRTESANYGIDNLLKYVRSCFQDEADLPVTFTLTGPFSRPTLIREKADEGRTNR